MRNGLTSRMVKTGKAIEKCQAYGENRNEKLWFDARTIKQECLTTAAGDDISMRVELKTKHVTVTPKRSKCHQPSQSSPCPSPFSPFSNLVRPHRIGQWLQHQSSYWCNLSVTCWPWHPPSWSTGNRSVPRTSWLLRSAAAVSDAHGAHGISPSNPPGAVTETSPAAWLMLGWWLMLGTGWLMGIQQS